MSSFIHYNCRRKEKRASAPRNCCLCTRDHTGATPLSPSADASLRRAPLTVPPPYSQMSRYSLLLLACALAVASCFVQTGVPLRGKQESRRRDSSCAPCAVLLPSPDASLDGRISATLRGGGPIAPPLGPIDAHHRGSLAASTTAPHGLRARRLSLCTGLPPQRMDPTRRARHVCALFFSAAPASLAPVARAAAPGMVVEESAAGVVTAVSAASALLASNSGDFGGYTIPIIGLTVLAATIGLLAGPVED